MSRRHIVTLLLVFTSFMYAAEKETKVPFTTGGIQSILGRNICSLEGNFPMRLGVYLDTQKEHALDYRQRNGISALFLLGRPLTSDCGTVEAVLNMSLILRKGESPEFKCFTKHEGGTTWGTWGHIVGVVDTFQGRKRYVQARRAWRVDIKKKQFEEITDQTVRCDTTGFES